MRRNAGFVQGHDIMAMLALAGAITLAVTLKGGALVIAAGVGFGLVLFVLARFTPNHRVHVELGCVVSLVELGILIGAGLACRRAGFEPLVSLSIACGVLAALLVSLAAALRRFDP